MAPILIATVQHRNNLLLYCCLLQVGAAIRVSGYAHAVAESTSVGQPALGSVEMSAQNISYSLPPNTITKHCFTQPEGYVDDPLHSLVLALVDAAGPIPLNPLAGLALLCSAAVAGHSMRQLQAGAAASQSLAGTAPGTTQLPASSMSQLTGGGEMAAASGVLKPLSVLIKHEQCEPLTPRIVRSAANLLSNQALAPGGSVSDVFQCRAGKVSCFDAATAEGALQVTASALVSANSGIFVLDHSLAFEAPSRGKSQACSQLAAAMAAPHLVVSSTHPELVVHNCATVWATIGQTAGPGKGESLLTDRFAIMCTNEVPDQACLAACLSDPTSDASTSSANLAQAAALKQHMARVAHLPLQMSISPMAAVRSMTIIDIDQTALVDLQIAVAAVRHSIAAAGLTQLWLQHLYISPHTLVAANC